MEKEQFVTCVPTEMFERLKKLLDRLWEEKNPAGVHLGAILEEFGTDIKSLNGVVAEYEQDFAGRAKFMEEQYKDKINTLEAALTDYKTRILGVEQLRQEKDGKAGELAALLKAKEDELSIYKARLSEEEAALNSKYAAKMHELYDKIGKKELEMLAGWEEKNRALELRSEAAEKEYAAKYKQLKLRESTMDEEVNSRKEELIKAFDRARLELESRDKILSEREARLDALEKKRATMTGEK